MTVPVLYSFRRCPYAIRARMALAYAGVRVELREVLLRDKPMEMLRLSPKGTVPVLVLEDGRVIDESIDVMRWALQQSDPEGWALGASRADPLIEVNDGSFKNQLDRYKYADRYPEKAADDYRDLACAHLETLERRLESTAFLAGDRAGFCDVALLPFIRQFAMVDRGWFDRAPYPALRRWLANWQDGELFTSVMFKLPRWEPGQDPTIADWKRSAAGKV
ncbi:MAG: glutathione S-transferase [Pseudomonadota bacterium]